MVAAMVLAHLVGDYILQWDSLARWKARDWRGVLVHGTVVWLATWAISALFDPGWWSWALVIGVTHTLLDTAPLWVARRVPPLARLAADQVVHLTVIALVLAASGCLDVAAVTGRAQAVLHDNRLLALALGYTFVTLPAWVLVEFSAYGLVAGSAPDFSQATNKYVGSLERGLITTCVLLGQFALVPLVAVPRLVLEWRQAPGGRRTGVYVAEWLASIALAVAVGLGLRQA